MYFKDNIQNNKKNNKRSTIKDIAREAKVSISTVSYVLNGIKDVKPDTRKRIDDAIQKYNYEPRMTARSLRTKQTYTIGVIVPEISNFFFTEIIHGIEDVAYKQGYSVILCNTNENAEKEHKYLMELLKKDIDGLVFIGTGQNQNIMENSKGIPVVMVDRKLGGMTSMVLVDNVIGSYTATRFLLEHGKGMPVHYLSGPITISTYYDRLGGYVKALNEAGYEYDERLIYQCGISIQNGYRLMQQLIESGQEIHSVFAANDILALGAMRAMIEKGFKVGEDILIIGYDDIDTAAMVTPALTTISQPKKELGIRAAELLIAKINNPDKPNEKIVLLPELIIRETAK